MFQCEHCNYMMVKEKNGVCGRCGNNTMFFIPSTDEIREGKRQLKETRLGQDTEAQLDEFDKRARY